MTGESGNHFIQPGRVPVAPVYARWGEVSASIATPGEVVDPVPPYFAGGGAQGAPASGAVETAEIPAVIFESPEASAIIPEAVVDTVAPELPGVGQPGAEPEIPGTEPLEVAAVAEEVVDPEPVAFVAEEVLEPEPLAAVLEESAEPEHPDFDPASAAAESGEVLEPAQAEEAEWSEWSEVTGTGGVTTASWLEVSVTAPASTEAHELATRLEAIAQRLRTDGTAAVVAGMRGDRLDALLAGVFAGYLAAREVDS